MANRRKPFVNMSFKVRYISALIIPPMFLALIIVFTGFFTTSNKIITIIENWNPSSAQLESSINRLTAYAYKASDITEVSISEIESANKHAKQALIMHGRDLQEASRLPGIVALFITIETILYVLIMSYIGSKVINNVIGPVHRLNYTMQDIKDGNMKAKIILRKGDELIPLADGLNDLTEMMATFVSQSRRDIVTLKEATEHLIRLIAEADKGSTEMGEYLNKLTKSADKLEEGFSRFQI